jgi:preprotein translocase subunit YajC
LTGTGFIILLVGLFVILWLLVIRPQRKRSDQQVAMQDRLRTGDEIITAGGLHATVKSIEDDVLEIEIAPKIIVRLDRRAVAAVVSQEEGFEDEAEEPVPSDDG